MATNLYSNEKTSYVNPLIMTSQDLFTFKELQTKRSAQNFSDIRDPGYDSEMLHTASEKYIAIITKEKQIKITEISSIVHLVREKS